MYDVPGLRVRLINVTARFVLTRIVQAARAKDEGKSGLPSRIVHLRVWNSVLCDLYADLTEFYRRSMP